LGLKIQKSPVRAKTYLILALFVNFGLLFVFKYFNFFANTFNQYQYLFPIKAAIPKLDLFLPLGISFYTLQSCGYLIDIYRLRIKPEKKFAVFTLFHSFFPQLTAGPIMRANTLFAQFQKVMKFDYPEISQGAKLFTFGLFKKMVVADNLGIIVDRVFTALPEYKGISLILAVICYSWQIYYDFSGYTDMTRGLGKMLGIDLLENFNLPYLASSLRDFWRRWHISLTSWLRDFIYIPLGGNRHGYLQTFRNILLVFTISGIWHGASWNFIIWGILNGFWLISERIIAGLFGRYIHPPKFVKIFYTYTIVSFFWIIFRSANLNDTFYIIRYSLTGMKNFLNPGYLWASLNQVFLYNQAEMLITFSLLLLAISAEFIRSKTTLDKILSKQPLVIRYSFYAMVVFLIIQLRNVDIKEFIYTRF
jgi:D-alanyl-lipoteichoic acid acyltransferase DltB (MBOAT superfamily)